ncbi:MAG TPA: Gfo/Idh/MocA family oxidoreductase [Acidimicrobiales bacterium]|nr:Gfo/Idh/MocA family oxidoreductase [Acidimicrobiales bacterium]
MDGLRWALVGTTGWADALFAPALRRTPGAVLRGAAGSGADGSTAFRDRHGAERAYRDLEELAADDAVDAVWVATPNDLHAAQAIRLLEAGKHVLVEKPLATRAKDAELVVDAARRNGRVLRVGYHHRFRSVHQALRRYVAEGRLGTVGAARFHAFSAYPHEPPAWRRSPERSGGWAINDVGTHLLDLVLWILGPAELAGAWFGNPRFGLDTDDTATLLLRLAGGGSCVVDTSTALESPGARIELYGTLGYLRAERSFEGAAVLDTSFGDAQHYPEDDAFRLEVEDFQRAVAGGESIGEAGELAVENVRLIQEARALDARRGA